MISFFGLCPQSGHRVKFHPITLSQKERPPLPASLAFALQNTSLSVRPINHQPPGEAMV
jgi:hypothetical protein